MILRIRALARRKPAGHQRTLRAAGVELNPLTRTASAAGERSISPTRSLPFTKPCSTRAPESSAPSSYSKRPRDENADPFTQTVKVTIGRHRRKRSEPPIIHTISGIGYRV
jgi:DNA-binding response OmpR family regulator